MVDVIMPQAALQTYMYVHVREAKFKYFQHAGALLTADGTDDDLMKFEGVPQKGTQQEYALLREGEGQQQYMTPGQQHSWRHTTPTGQGGSGRAADAIALALADEEPVTHERVRKPKRKSRRSWRELGRAKSKGAQSSRSRRLQRAKARRIHSDDRSLCTLYNF